MEAPELSKEKPPVKSRGEMPAPAPAPGRRTPPQLLLAIPFWAPWLALGLVLVAEFNTAGLRYASVVLAGAATLFIWLILGWRFSESTRRWPRLERRAWMAALVVSVFTALAGAFALNIPALISWPGLRFALAPLERNAFKNDPSVQINVIHAAAGGRLVWAAGDAGLILFSSNYGKTWRRQDSSTGVHLRSIAFSSNERGTAVGDSNTLLTTSDGGRTWSSPYEVLTIESPVAEGEEMPRSDWTPLPDHFVQVEFGSAQNGLAIRMDGSVFETKNGGATWGRSPVTEALRQRLPVEPLRSMAFSSPTNAVIGGSGGSVLALVQKQGDWEVTAAPEPVQRVQNWNKRLTGTEISLVKLVALDPANVFALWHSAAAQSNSPTQSIISSLHDPRQFVFAGKAKVSDLLFQAPDQLWLASTAGEIIALPSSALSSDPSQPADLKQGDSGEQGHQLASADGVVFCASPRTVFRTDDGRTWREAAASFRAYPPPVFWLLLILCLASAITLLVRCVPAPIDKESDPDYAVSDAAVERVQDDKLGFRGLALGLAAFIKNANTKPPLVIAVTADWGFGKSSILNMVSDDLKSTQYPVVHFNAWHHQNEEQVFAILLKNVVQGVPSMLSRPGVDFRARLYWHRIQKRKFQAMLWLLLFAVLAWPVVNFLSRDLFTAGAPASEASATSGPLAEMVIRPLDTEPAQDLAQLLRGGVKVDWTKRPEPPSQESAFTAWIKRYFKGHGSWAQWGTWIVISSVSLFQFVSRLRAFGLDPARLLAQAKGGARLADLEAKASFQLRFAEQFREVTDAMGLKQLTIFIDDLDRCRPAKVTEMLEAINFLVASGRCFVVLAFSRLQVEAALGLGFASVAEETDFATNLWREENELRTRTGQPPLPQPSGETLSRLNRQLFARLYLKKLINLEVAVPTPADTSLLNMLTNARNGEMSEPPIPTRNSLPGARVPAAALGLLCAILWPALSHAEVPPEDKRPPQTQSRQVLQTRPTIVPLVPDRALPPYRWWWALVPMAAVGGLALRSLSQRPSEHALDPPELRHALGIWLPWVRKRFTTPRELKRFLNVVRYVVTLVGSDASQALLPPHLKGVRLEPQDVVYLSARAVQLNSAHSGEWEAYSKMHLDHFRREPSQAADALFEWLVRDLPLKA